MTVLVVIIGTGQDHVRIPYRSLFCLNLEAMRMRRCREHRVSKMSLPALKGSQAESLR